MNSYKIALLPGDGIGPEVTAEAVKAVEDKAELAKAKAAVARAAAEAKAEETEVPA